MHHKTLGNNAMTVKCYNIRVSPCPISIATAMTQRVSSGPANDTSSSLQRICIKNSNLIRYHCLYSLYKVIIYKKKNVHTSKSNEKVYVLLYLHVLCANMSDKKFN